MWSKDVVQEFISALRDEECLYNTQLPEYLNRKEKVLALKRIQNHLVSQFGGNYEVEEIKRKIKSLRTQMARELRLVDQSRRTRVSGEEVYQPRLWCFNLLEFLRPFTLSRHNQQNVDGESSEHAENGKIWPRKTIKDLIDLLKRFPCLYATTKEEYRNKEKRRNAYRCIYEIIKKYHDVFTFEETKERIRTLRTSFVRELRNIEHARMVDKKYTPKLWYFEQLRFLEPYCRGNHFAESYGQEITLDDVDFEDSQFQEVSARDVGSHTENYLNKSDYDLDDPLDCLSNEDSLPTPMKSSNNCEAKRIWVKQRTIFEGDGGVNEKDACFVEPNSSLNPASSAKRLKMSEDILQQTTKLVENITAKINRNTDDIAIYARSWETSFRRLTEEQQILAKKAIEEILILGQLQRLTYTSVKPIDWKK